MLNLRKLADSYELICVDLDNTLFNYTIANNIAIETVLKKFNITSKEYETARINIKKRDLEVNHHKKEFYFKNICETKNLPLITALDMYNLYDKTFTDNLLADASMMDLIIYAKKQKKKVIAITNYYVIPQLVKLKSTNFIQYIDHLVTSEEFEVEKPNKSLLTRAIELAEYPNFSDIIMIGDSVADNLSALGVDYYPYNCSKLLISVSGKSGAGKSTLTNKIKHIWDAQIIEGDGYHKYERSHEAWNNITHYNPEGNNLIQLSLDIQKIYHDIGKVNVPIYNHHNGLFDKPKELLDLDATIIEGLHTLYPTVTGDYVKIRIFIESIHSDNQKITRDVEKRNKDESSVLKSISTREDDYNKYVAPQKKYSNFLIEVNKECFTITLSDELVKNENIVIENINENLYQEIEKVMNELKTTRYIHNE